MVKLKKQKVRTRKKTVPSSVPERRIKTVIKFLIIALLVGGIGVGLVCLKYMFVDSEYFVVGEIDVKLYDQDRSLRTLSLNEAVGRDILGTNIFFVDLNALREKIGLFHPEIKDIIVRRLLPNKLIVEGELRKGIAQIHSDRFYLVDKEGVFLPDVKNFPDPNIPVIDGIGINLAKVKMSKFTKFEKDKIDKALGLIIEIEDIDELSNHKLKRVDTADPGNLSFFFEGLNVEIKIGSSDFRDRLQALVTVLTQFGTDINNFRYIDLRFEDPIVGPR